MSEKGALLANSDLPQGLAEELKGPARSRPPNRFGILGRTLELFWWLSESDLPTFVLPNICFGTFGALSTQMGGVGPRLPTTGVLFHRLPVVIFFNWYTVLIFEMGNQRCPESVAEDTINKPWRPIPSGMVTSLQVRRIMLTTVPICLALNYYLGVWELGAFIHIMHWMYNDLGGGDEACRDLVIAVGDGLYNAASLQLGIGVETPLGYWGILWTAMVSVVILTTMQVQDLKDQGGDIARGRWTMPLVFGEQVSRCLIAFWVTFWSIGCSYFWHLPWWGYCVPLSLRSAIVANVLRNRTFKDDQLTWRMWAIWMCTLYTLPVISRVANGI